MIFFSESIAWLIKSSTLQLGGWVKGALSSFSTRTKFDPSSSSRWLSPLTRTNKDLKEWQILQKGTFWRVFSPSERWEIVTVTQASPTSRALHVYIDSLICPKCIFMSPSCIWRNVSKTKLSENTYLGLLSVQAVAARIRPREGGHQCFQYQSMFRGETQNLMELQIVQFFFT